MITYEIRKANLNDSKGIANVHVESWVETYTGIVPDKYLATLSKTNRQSMWLNIISANKANQFTFVATVNDEVVGFVNGGEARQKEHGLGGELYAIYLLKKFQGKGIGKELFNHFASSLKSDGIQSMYLWVFRDNLTIKFYQKMGGLKGVDKEDEIAGKVLIEELYYWNQL